MRGSNGNTPSHPWVLDAGLTDVENDVRVFVPVGADGNAIVGMTVMTDKPPGPVIGVIHPDGNEAVLAWVEENREYLTMVLEETGGTA